jgi:hypothetical protein
LTYYYYPLHARVRACGNNHKDITMEEKSSDHLVLGGLLFLVFSLVVALVFVYTRAGNTTTGGGATTTAQVANVPPAIDSVNVAYADNGANLDETTGIDLALGTTKQIVIWGTASDANGTATQGSNTYGDIKDINVVFYRSGVTDADSCTADNNNCYRAQLSDSSCVFSGNSGTTVHYACTLNLQYFTDSTQAGGEFPTDNWIAKVTDTDLSDTTGTASATTNVNSLLALNIPASIAYGQFALGATTTGSATLSGNGSNIIMPITQEGNVVADVNVSGSDMTCDGLGTIPVGNEAWALGAVDYSAATPLTASAVNTLIGVDYQTDDNFATNPSLKDLYWHIKIPATGVRGVCTGSNTLSIIAH